MRSAEFGVSTPSSLLFDVVIVAGSRPGFCCLPIGDLRPPWHRVCAWRVIFRENILLKPDTKKINLIIATYLLKA